MFGFPSRAGADDDELNRDDDCPRARVPRPSNRDYVVRPISTVEMSEKKVGFACWNRLSSHCLVGRWKEEDYFTIR